jgi:hypothetical protein
MRGVEDATRFTKVDGCLQSHSLVFQSRMVRSTNCCGGIRRAQMLLSVGQQPSGEVWANGASVNPAISGDSLYVAFSSRATNLSTTDTNATDDIFTHTWVDASTRTQCDTKKQTKTLPFPLPWARIPAPPATDYDERCQDDSRRATRIRPRTGRRRHSSTRSSTRSKHFPGRRPPHSFVRTVWQCPHLFHKGRLEWLGISTHLRQARLECVHQREGGTRIRRAAGYTASRQRLNI